MKLSNQEIINCVVGLNQLAQKEFPLATAFKVENLRKALEPFAVSATKLIDDIKREHAISIKGSKVEFRPEDVELINEKINEIANSTKDFDDNLKIPISSIPTESEISPNVIKLVWEVLE